MLAVDPVGLGGAVLRGPPSAQRDAWLALLRCALPEGSPILRLPAATEDDRLLGGVDLVATLAAGRPVVVRGVLAQADGGIVVAATAERLVPAVAARLAHALDRSEVVLAREGVSERFAVRCALVALDEGIGEERVPAVLRERLAFEVPLEEPCAFETLEPSAVRARVSAARSRLAMVRYQDSALAVLCGAAVAFGIDSLRAPLIALRAARAAAALDRRDTVNEHDLACAARLVFAPRATRLPAPPEDATPPERPPDAADNPGESAESLDDRVLAAVRAAVPPGLLEFLQPGVMRGRGGARSDASRRSGRRGRPAGIRAGNPGHGRRLALVATLTAAAPWQRLRRRGRAYGDLRIEVRRQDFRVRQYRERVTTTTVFVVDASGSTALHRLAEAKGAVELLLADCYVRRDQVAMFAFRGRSAELLLPPTRSLARARRALAELPGGGGTPLAAAIEAAVELALRIRGRGGRPLLVLLTDGKANIALDGTPGREAAARDALSAARRGRLAGVPMLLIDTSPQPQDAARAVASAASARYLALPHADAHLLSAGVRSVLSAGSE